MNVGSLVNSCPVSKKHSARREWDVSFLYAFVRCLRTSIGRLRRLDLPAVPEEWDAEATPEPGEVTYMRITSSCWDQLVPIPCKSVPVLEGLQANGRVER